MGWEQKYYCCCLSVRTGTLILGFMALLGLMQEVDDFHAMRAAANGAIAAAFFLLLVKDTETNRKVFFYIYLFGTIVLYLFGVFNAYDHLERVEPWKQACDDLKRKGELQNFHTNTIEECHDKMQTIINASMTIFFVLLFLLQVHFYAVVYTHWKNYTKDNSSDVERRRLHDEV